ncbi:ATP-binding cassette domain-containing protein, partial [Oceanobacillus massiliensis]
MGKELLEIKNLSTSFRIADEYYAAVDDVTLTLNKNEVLGIVGESGSGKSALAFSVMGLHNHAKIEGEILLNDRDIARLSPSKMNKLRGDDMAMIFQDPLTALNPLMHVGDQIAETIVLHRQNM